MSITEVKKDPCDDAPSSSQGSFRQARMASITQYELLATDIDGVFGEECRLLALPLLSGRAGVVRPKVA